jgi:hypothetical protein
MEHCTYSSAVIACEQNGTAVTTKRTEPSESALRKRKILPHAIDTQILEFTVLYKMWELKGWMDKGEPNLLDKSHLAKK